MNNIKQFLLHLSYQGSSYNGIQINKSAPRPICKVIHNSLLHFLPTLNPFSVITSSRTDRGVHAYVNTVRFLTNSPNEFFVADLRYAMNLKFVQDKEFINIHQIKQIPKETNILTSVARRVYQYKLCVLNDFHACESFNPVFSWNKWQQMMIGSPFDARKMYRAAELLNGCHDFSGFSNLQGITNAKTSTKNLKIFIEKCNNNKLSNSIFNEFSYDYYNIFISGESFMNKMVRFLVGCMIKAGQGLLEEEKIIDVLNNGVYYLQEKPFEVAVPFGLYLYDIVYDNEELNIDREQFVNELRNRDKYPFDIYKNPLPLVNSGTTDSVNDEKERDDNSINVNNEECINNQ